MKYYTTDEAAALFKLNRKTIRREIAAGHLVAKLVAGRWRIEERDLMNWDDRNNNANSKNATVASGQPNPDKLSSPQLKNIIKAEIKPNSANTTNGKSAEPTIIGQEKADSYKTTENAEEFVKYWNLYSPCKQPFTPEGHLPEPIKRMVERFMVANNNDLTYCQLTIRILFYLFDKDLIKSNRAAITLTQYIKRDYHTSFAFPQLTQEQEKELEKALATHEIYCYRCNKYTEIDDEQTKEVCSQCGQQDEIEIHFQAIKEDGMKKYPVLKMFYDKYKMYLEQSRAKIWARHLAAEEEFLEGMNNYKPKSIVSVNAKDPNKLDWSIIADMNDIKKEIYDPQYAQEMAKHLPIDE